VSRTGNCLIHITQAPSWSGNSDATGVTHVATLRSSLTYREMPEARFGRWLYTYWYLNFIYKYTHKNYHCHHSWRVDLNCRRTLSVLVLVSRTDPCNLLLPTKTYVPSSALWQELIDTIRRFVLLVPLLFLFSIRSDIVSRSVSPFDYIFYTWCF